MSPCATFSLVLPSTWSNQNSSYHTSIGCSVCPPIIRTLNKKEKYKHQRSQIWTLTAVQPFILKERGLTSYTSVEMQGQRQSPFGVWSTIPQPAATRETGAMDGVCEQHQTMACRLLRSAALGQNQSGWCGQRTPSLAHTPSSSLFCSRHPCTQNQGEKQE